MACRSRAPNWREVLPIHPAAQLLPHMTEQELRELGEDIKARGLLQPIFIFQELVGGKDFRYSLLDGVNQLDAMALIGIKFKIDHDDSCGWTLNIESHSHSERDVPAPVVVADGSDDPFALVLSANLHRRHLTIDQKRELIAKLLHATPEKSNRQIAEAVRVDHKTVAAVRIEKQATGEIPQLTKTIGKDGKERAHKPRPIRDLAVIAAADRPAARLHARTQRLEHATDPKTQALHQSDPDNLISQFIARIRSSGREIARRIGAAYWPILVERLREVTDEIELEAECWAKEGHLPELPDFPEFLRRNAP